MTELSENSLILRNRKSQSVDLWNAKCSGEGRERLQKQNEDMDAFVIWTLQNVTLKSLSKRKEWQDTDTGM